MVYLTRKIEFSASHLYHNPAMSAEENRRVFGKCNNPHGHGHNYTLEVTVAGEPDPVTGMVLDLKALKDILEQEITQRMDHRFLNYEVAELKGQIPTCENIARVIWNRLHSERLSAEENSRVFGKCNNPYGHGHNYVVEIRVSGAVDPDTGMIANLADLDAFVEREVIEPFDHKSFNEDVPAFREAVPTTENLCIEIFQRLKRFPRAKLERVRVEETGNNSFEYAGEEFKDGSTV